MTNRPFVILMAEDNEHDIVATQRAWQKNNIANPLYIVNDGEECLDYLYQRGKYSEPNSAPRPGILLLDISMPKLDGLAVLEHIRNDETLHRLPVVIMTTSQQKRIVYEAMIWALTLISGSLLDLAGSVTP
jgi:CheY-like chemotaxis protein